jgi:hypothetical protein
MQHIAIFKPVILQLLKPGAVKRNIRIFLYVPVQPDTTFLQLLPEPQSELRLYPSQRFIKVAALKGLLFGSQI